MKGRSPSTCLHELPSIPHKHHTYTKKTHKKILIHSPYSSPPMSEVGTLMQMFAERPMVIYHKHVHACSKFWKRKVADSAAALALGQKCVEPVQYPGILRLHKVRTDFAGSMPEWAPYQTEVFEMFVNTNLINILGPDADTCRESVMRDSGWTTIPDEKLVVATRGSGKSTMLACAIAAFLKNIVDYTAMVYSGKQSKSDDLLESIWTAFLHMVDNDKECLTHISSMRKTITKITVTIDGNTRQIISASAFGLVSHLPPSLFAFFLKQGSEDLPCVDWLSPPLFLIDKHQIKKCCYFLLILFTYLLFSLRNVWYGSSH
jgi:hypothetical protein